MSRDQKKQWYQESPDAVLHALHVDHAKGLSGAEVAHRLGIDGRNVFREAVRETLIERVVNELKNPLAFILLIAGMVTTVMADYVDASVIFIALSINVAISLYQEGRADKAFERLRSSQVKRATVIRDGERRIVDASELVPGDIVVMETGGNVPADLRIIEAGNCAVNEAVLTGEWFEVEKFAEKIDRSVTITEQKNMLWMGTLVTGGSARGVVVATGMKTELGAIAAGLAEKDTQRTPLQENVATIARFLAYLVFAALIAIFALGLIRGESFRELFLISIAIAVAAIPEGLPAAVTVVLAIGMEQILKRGGLVRNLLAAETLGSTTVILTDKTGTLTEASMQVARVLTLGSLVLEARHTGAGKRV
ncbi:MAG TPA: HAD-IC family P-type ATPase, partial [Candidatus Paceibacterota bacterium]|nr:HAD-IC family P-type ATPase [Candidatus Paceibacterota bacterium]